MKKINIIGDKILFSLPFVIIAAGIYIRIALFCENYPLWNDEILLADNIVSKSFFQLFLHLENVQVAPPLFLILQKIIVELADYNLWSFRIVSIISGCLSMPLFYKLLNKNFKSKIAIYSALFLFSFNPQLIYYSNEFKPYSTDVLFCIIFLLIYEKLNIKDKKSFILYSLLMFIAPFCSFISIFIIGAIVILKVLTVEQKDKLKYAFLSVPAASASLILWLIENIHYNELTKYLLWEYGFFNFSISHNYKIFTDFLEYIQMNSWIFTVIILFVIIISLFIKNKTIYLSILSLLLCCIASFIKVFPFSERVILFLIPIFIILISSIFEYFYKISFKSEILKRGCSLIILALILINLQYNYADVFINKNVPMIESKDFRIKRENAIINFLSNYNSEDLIITTPKLIPYINMYNVVKKYNKRINIKTFNNVPEEEYKELEVMSKFIKDNENNTFWFIYFNPWNNFYYATYNVISEEILSKLSLKYKKYEQDYADTFYVEGKL